MSEQAEPARAGTAAAPGAPASVLAAGGGVVTPEAVPLEFETAGVGSRSVAIALDLALQLTVITTLVLAVSLVAGGAGIGLPSWVAVTAMLLLVFGVFWGYPVALETLWRGRTLGKAAMGLRVVTREGAPVRLRHAAIRAAFTLVDFYATSGVAAVVAALLTREHQRLGDLVAGTLVLRERTGAGRPRPVRFAVPPGAEAYAATIDPAGIAAEHYALVRAFLLRAHELVPDARDRLARELASGLAARIGHRPPPGTPAETFLVSLAARYQQRTAPPPPDGAAGPDGAWAPSGRSSADGAPAAVQEGGMGPQRGAPAAESPGLTPPG